MRNEKIKMYGTECDMKDIDEIEREHKSRKNNLYLEEVEFGPTRINADIRASKQDVLILDGTG